MIKYTKKRHYSCVQYYNCFDVCAFDGEHTHALFSIGGRNTEKHKVISVICSCKSSAFQGYIQDHVYAWYYPQGGDPLLPTHLYNNILLLVRKSYS